MKDKDGKKLIVLGIGLALVFACGVYFLASSFL